MRENRPYGSEGGEGNSFPTPIEGVTARANKLQRWEGSQFTAGPAAHTLSFACTTGWGRPGSSRPRRTVLGCGSGGTARQGTDFDTAGRQARRQDLRKQDPRNKSFKTRPSQQLSRV